MNECDREVLRVMLGLAVPMWIERLAKRPFDAILARGPELAQIIAEKGDVLQFKSNKAGKTAEAFNALAEALASLAFFPGGVRFMGCHWTAEHADAMQPHTSSDVCARVGSP